MAAASRESLRLHRPLVLVRGGEHAVGDLVAASDHAALVVVGAGSPGIGRVRRGLAVASAAHCPVLVVPSPDPLGRPRRDVVVGISARATTRDADALLVQTALRAAADRGTGVLAVHAWQDTALEPDRWNTPGLVDWALLRPDEHRTLAEVLAGCTQDWPDVPLRRVVVRAPLGPTLLATALSARLLVLGVHRGHARPATRFLLHRPPCPVQLIPVGPTPERAPTRSRRLPHVLEPHR